MSSSSRIIKLNPYFGALPEFANGLQTGEIPYQGTTDLKGGVSAINVISPTEMEGFALVQPLRNGDYLVFMNDLGDVATGTHVVETNVIGYATPNIIFTHFTVDIPVVISTGSSQILFAMNTGATNNPMYRFGILQTVNTANNPVTGEIEVLGIGVTVSTGDNFTVHTFTGTTGSISMDAISATITGDNFVVYNFTGTMSPDFGAMQFMMVTDDKPVALSSILTQSTVTGERNIIRFED